MSDPQSPRPTPQSADANATRDGDPGITGSTLETHSQSATESIAPAPGAMFGRYRIVRELGRGGMGTVYLAEDTRLGRLVALKVPNLDPGQRQSAERFLKEARLTAGLHHRNICTVFDAGEENGCLYLTMAYVEGQPLRERVAEYAVGPPTRALELVRKIAVAVGAAHAKGIVHRDLKPGNVMLDACGEPIVMDFGLARHLGGLTETRPGTPLGTPAYMPPEQARGDLAAIGPCSDIYSLGVVLYELLTGALPFQGDNAMALLYQAIHNPPPPLETHRPGLDPRLETICQKALAKEPGQRFGSMNELASVLDACQYASGPASVPPPIAATESQFIANVLDQLRHWGWEAGLSRLRGSVETAANADERHALEFLIGWLAGERGNEEVARSQFHALAARPELAPWAAIGLAFVAYRNFEYDRVPALLDQAAKGDPGDTTLQATLAHLRGTLAHRLGRPDAALRYLNDALCLYGPGHFGTGRVLDSFGMVYAAKDNFHAAREFYLQSMACKERFADEAGLALSHGQLGRLCLDWGQLDRAEEHFQQNLRLAQRIRNPRAEAQMLDHLGQVSLARGELELAHDRKSAARREFTRAADWLDASIRLSQLCKHSVQEGFARKDRAHVHLLERQLDDAEQMARQAGELFQRVGFAEGSAHVQRILGCVARERGEVDTAQQLLTLALDYFDRTSERAEATRTQLEIARTLRAGRAPRRLVSEAFANALDRAESCRRAALVASIEDELRAEDEEAHWRQVFRRVRGRNVPDDTSSLFNGTSEVATVLFLNLRGFIPFCQGLDPGDVMTTLNQLMADLAVVLERNQAEVTAYLGGGFMALLRDGGHAPRAVHTALDLLGIIEEFNRPRELLGLRRIPAEIGIATGPVCVGNIGTYRKMNFTAVGFAVNLAGRLMRHSLHDITAPCISRETYDLVRDRFLFQPDNPRVVDLREIGKREAWDVVGRNPEYSSGGSRKQLVT